MPQEKLTRAAAQVDAGPGAAAPVAPQREAAKMKTLERTQETITSCSGPREILRNPEDANSLGHLSASVLSHSASAGLLLRPSTDMCPNKLARDMRGFSTVS
jgi:hypothetical protein